MGNIMFIILLIALLAIVNADRTWRIRHNKFPKYWTTFRRVGSITVKPANGRWTTTWTSKPRRFWLSSPWGTVRVSKQSGGGTWTRCVRRYWNMAGHLKAVQYKYIQGTLCRLGIRYYTSHASWRYP